MRVLSRSMSARISVAAAPPLSSVPAWHVPHRLSVSVPSIVSDGCSTAWLLWHSTQALSKICAWTLVANFLGEHGVARAAHVDDRSDSRRRCAVIAVTVVARRCREIVAFGQRGVVHALLVFGELVVGSGDPSGSV